MTAYVIVDIRVHDPVRYEAYKQMAAPTVTAHGGKYIARGGRVQTLEGEWAPTRLVILEFPNAEQARVWLDSDDYAPARALRHATARTQMIVVDGLDA
jgi:uncharacterized protein (DUF1330 family)